MKKIKSPLREFVSIVDDMTITKKTSLLFLIMLAGMLFIGSFAHISINKIKENFDNLYTKRMAPIGQLEKIKDNYTVEIKDALKHIGESKKSISVAKNKILIANEAINKNITHLINYNLQSANSGKKRTEKVYENTFLWIVFATVGTILVAALLALVILQNIRQLYERLSLMVDEKTKELKALNTQLEERITKEVANSRRKDEIMFRQSRLAGMGEMMGNIAHQWRQPLNALVLVVQSFGMKKLVGKLNDDFVDKQVEEGIRLGESMSKTIDDFRNFFKPNRVKEVFSIKNSILHTIDLVQGFYKRDNIDINLILQSDIVFEGYPNEFSQVIMNLLSNAKDALNSTKNLKKHIEILIKMDKKIGCKVSIIDNGGGIEDKVLDRMFEPYFTTKHQSNGTGIGLYMSKEIIEEHMGGFIGARNISHKFNEDEKIYEKCASINIIMPCQKAQKGV